ncbi:hypothetical protein DSECCO2_630870 [anaerobic digester metagenome]|jgi:hypothetical protein|uniref:Uncharacterized protein n=1 Tax=Methanoculleus marisnigri (strain ATCC 35101 / DSM 1498 / JR1) TaxID=368407 RepID=A3CW47_METMJ|nr:hypothetical protein Memar_1670 [Methanoculleus marisnigri JR1]
MLNVIFILKVKYIYLDEVSALMHALGKWIASDPVFDILGTLIFGTGILILIFAGLVLYASGL